MVILEIQAHLKTFTFFYLPIYISANILVVTAEYLFFLQLPDNTNNLPQINLNLNHVRWGPCPHSMARPQVADGGTASSYGD
jgi:hypothetical protein